MGVSERKERQRGERERHIVATARHVAAAEGWAAVTIRRLADEIEYSQPVLYSHFRNRGAIIGAVALEGFGELADALHGAMDAGADRERRIGAVANAYVEFAFEHPALYEAMFTLQSDLRFAHADTPPELRRAFAAFREAVTPFCLNAEVAAETFWSALHGLGELERTGRTKPAWRQDRIDLVVQATMMVEGGRRGRRSTPTIPAA